MNKIAIWEFSFLIPFLPCFFQPNPGSVIHINKVLIIKMYSWYAFLNHFFSTKKWLFLKFEHSIRYYNNTTPKLRLSNRFFICLFLYNKRYYRVFIIIYRYSFTAFSSISISKCFPFLVNSSPSTCDTTKPDRESTTTRFALP